MSASKKERKIKILLTGIKAPEGVLHVRVLPRNWLNWIEFFFFYSLPESGIGYRPLLLSHKPQDSFVIPKHKHLANTEITIYLRNSTLVGSIFYSAKDLKISDEVTQASNSTSLFFMLQSLSFT